MGQAMGQTEKAPGRTTELLIVRRTPEAGWLRTGLMAGGQVMYRGAGVSGRDERLCVKRHGTPPANDVNRTAAALAAYES